MISQFMAAATLAANCSAGRQSQVELKLTKEGLIVLGQFKHANGAVLYGYRKLIGWQRLADHPESIVAAIKDIDAKLAGHWRGAVSSLEMEPGA